jgi:hypothetical protein
LVDLKAFFRVAIITALTIRTLDLAGIVFAPLILAIMSRIITQPLVHRTSCTFGLVDVIKATRIASLERRSGGHFRFNVVESDYDEVIDFRAAVRHD